MLGSVAARWPRIVTPDRDGIARVASRQVYILPSRYGLVFLLLLVICLIGAVNYGNNPAFLLTFLLAGLGANTIYQTWRNLNAIGLYPLGADPVFAGTEATYRFRLVNERGMSRPAIQLHWRHEDGDAEVIDIPAEDAQTLSLAAATSTRGRHYADTVIVSTRYPLGLLRAWCYVDSNADCLVYPRPARHWEPPPAPGGQGEAAGDRGIGTEDFRGLRGYRAGDSPAHVHWKALAREQGLQTKLFCGEQAPQLWIDWEQADATDTETRLSQMCRGLLDAESVGSTYGLRMPDAEIAPDQGEDHLRRCLTKLALYEVAT